MFTNYTLLSVKNFKGLKKKNNNNKHFTVFYFFMTKCFQQLQINNREKFSF